jgi:hypothetical protein
VCFFARQIASTEKTGSLESAVDLSGRQGVLQAIQVLISFSI